MNKQIKEQIRQQIKDAIDEANKVIEPLGARAEYPEYFIFNGEKVMMNTEQFGQPYDAGGL